jgi:DUF971 family protein
VKANAFDKAYFERFYFNRRTRIAEPSYFDQLAAFTGAYLKLLDCPVGRVLDIGCGAGLLHRGLRRAFPGVKVLGWEKVGNYAFRFEFSDGHRTGLYSYDYLRNLAARSQP